MEVESSSEQEPPQYTYTPVSRVLIADSPSAFAFLKCYVKQNSSFKMLPTLGQHFVIYKSDGEVCVFPKTLNDVITGKMVNKKFQ